MEDFVMSENESSEWISYERDSISERVDALGAGLHAALARAEKLLVDIEFVRIMAEEDLL
jgi:hypothetical protein